MDALRFAARAVATAVAIAVYAISCAAAVAAPGYGPASPAGEQGAAAGPAATVNASEVAAPDAAGVVDPRRAFMLRAVFAQTVTRRLKVPATEQRAYANRLEAALTANTLGNLSGEYVALVDRSANVQALFVFFRAAPADNWQMIGASPVSTGRPGEYDHFITPLGVFEHTPSNMDFRSEGTQNENHIRGYGKRDMRIFDLGWAQGERGWGKGGMSQMRLQMHATDPDRLGADRLGQIAVGVEKRPAGYALGGALHRRGGLAAQRPARMGAGTRQQGACESAGRRGHRRLSHRCPVFGEPFDGCPHERPGERPR
jgi:hypothetical protein